MALKEAMPREYMQDETSKAHRFDDIEVVWQKDIMSNQTSMWPGKHRNVHFWVILKNGYAVGWNENPSTGWSFPLIKI